MLTDEDVVTLCEAGAMAPSGGNAQPWRVSVDGDRLTVSTSGRPDGFLDVAGHASHFAAGCFAENLAIAATSLGLEYKAAVSTGAVEFTFTGRHAATPHELFHYLPQRVTNRRTDHTGPVSEVTVDQITRVDPGLRIAAVSAPERKRVIAGALGAADAVRMRNAATFADMMREICWTDAETRERRRGLDIRTLELPATTLRLLGLLKRFPAARLLLPAGRLADTARTLVQNCSHICCLASSSAPGPDAMVAAGMAMQRVWLTATRHGVWLHPWTVSTLLLLRLESFAGAGLDQAERRRVARFGAGLREGFGLGPDERPLFVFRLFRAPPPAAWSVRLPWQSFTTMAQERT